MFCYAWFDPTHKDSSCIQQDIWVSHQTFVWVKIWLQLSEPNIQLMSHVNTKYALPSFNKSAFPGIQLPYESKKDCVLFFLEFCQESFTSLKNHTTDCLIALGICVSETIHVNRFICTHQSPRGSRQTFVMSLNVCPSIYVQKHPFYSILLAFFPITVKVLFWIF